MFSVVIPTHNRAKDLNICLQSLFNQEFKYFEILVIDDGSTDNTADICEQFSPVLNLRYIYLEKCSGGPAHPRNIGIKNSAFSWIAFLDSDDIWSENKLQRIVDQILLNPQVDLIFHKFHGLANNVIVQPNSLLRQLFLKGNLIVNSSVVVRKSILDKLNGFDAEPKLISAEDYDLWIRISTETDKFIYLDEPLGTYTFTEDSISLNYQRKLLNFLYLYNKHSKIYNSNFRYLYVFAKTYIKHLLLYFKQNYERLY
jgi:glycosyltransferase involved in cell wall biosynthesis